MVQLTPRDLYHYDRMLHLRQTGQIASESVPCWEPMKTQVGRFTHHDLRHYFTTDAIQRGVDIPTIAKWLGYKDGGPLLIKTYSHLLQDHSRAMAKKL